MKKLNCVMTERQLRMCALILYAGGYDYEEAAFTLGVSKEEVTQYTSQGADEHWEELYPRMDTNNFEAAQTDPERGKLQEMMGEEH